LPIQPEHAHVTRRGAKADVTLVERFDGARPDDPEPLRRDRLHVFNPEVAIFVAGRLVDPRDVGRRRRQGQMLGAPAAEQADRSEHDDQPNAPNVHAGEHNKGRSACLPTC
jgi:hypothetical protein